MSDEIAVDADMTDLIAALESLGPFAQPFLNAASKQSADSITHEARERLHRKLGPDATGQTEASIVNRPAFDGNGFVVVAEREPMPNLPLWLEKGTKKGRSTHANIARPFFYVSAQLEEGPHWRRVADALQQAIDAKGLGS